MFFESIAELAKNKKRSSIFTQKKFDEWIKCIRDYKHKGFEFNETDAKLAFKGKEI